MKLYTTPRLVAIVFNESDAVRTSNLAKVNKASAISSRKWLRAILLRANRSKRRKRNEK